MNFFSENYFIHQKIQSEYTNNRLINWEVSRLMRVGKPKTLGLTLGAVGSGILIALLIPTGTLAFIEGVILVILGFILIRS
jgi:uncharacterized protein (DUF2062 family)